VNHGLDIAKLESNGHSLFGASKSHRILPCPGSLLAEIGLPDSASYDAAEGTVAHHLAEKVAHIGLHFGVLTGRDFSPWIGTCETVKMETGNYTIEITEDMAEYVREYVQWCLDAEGDQHFEQRVDYSDLTPIPDQGGTADHISLRPGHLTITDLKYGTGVQVFAERNPQAMLYALGAIRAWDWLYSFETVTIRICQPRLSHFDVWETTVAELEAFGQEAKERFALAWTANAPRKPTEKGCQFCRARPTCPAMVALIDNIADETFVDETFTAGQIEASVSNMETGFFPNTALVKPAVLGTAQLGVILQYRKLVEGWFGDVFDELQRRITAGEEAPEGWMIAAGKTVRYIADSVVPDVEKLLLGRGLKRADLYQPEALKSPAQLEALAVGKLKIPKKEAVQLLEGLVSSLPGSPVLARKTPGRKAAIDLADASFVDETPETETL
jgi:hypothetical protein